MFDEYDIYMSAVPCVILRVSVLLNLHIEIQLS